MMKSHLTNITPSDIGDLTDSKRPIIADLAYVEKPHRIDPHQHQRGQLIFASHGSLLVKSMGPVLMVPPQFAVWIPPDIIHSVTANTSIHYCSLFIDALASTILPTVPQLLHITTLLKELTRAAANGSHAEISDAGSRLNYVILDQLQTLKPARVALPVPDSERMHKLVEHFLLNPGDHIDLHYWSEQLSMSERSLTRNFTKETGMSFGQWLQHLKVLKAIELLEAGEMVKSIAFDLGYQQTSAFISMFKRVTGQTPKEYLPD